MADFLEVTETIEFDELKYQKNLEDHDWSHKETDLRGDNDDTINN